MTKESFLELNLLRFLHHLPSQCANEQDSTTPISIICQALLCSCLIHISTKLLCYLHSNTRSGYKNESLLHLHPFPLCFLCVLTVFVYSISIFINLLFPKFICERLGN